MPDRHQSTLQPLNAFRPTFLEMLTHGDGTLTAAEGEFSGPWKVEPLGGRYAVLRNWEDLAQGDAAFATLKHEETASILAAVLPAVGREPLFHLGTERVGEGFSLSAVYGEQGPVEVGSLSVFEPTAVLALHIVEYLTRTPSALASILLASGPSAIENVGRILSREIEREGSLSQEPTC